MKINVKITGLEDLTKAITGWTDALQALQMPRVNNIINEQPQAPQPLPQPQPVSPVVVPEQPVYQQQQQYPAAPVNVASMPVNPPVQNMNAVPVSAPAYSMDQLAVAATQLTDNGQQQNLIDLLQSYGVAALTMLPKEHYGSFATQLRSMGARI